MHVRAHRLPVDVRLGQAQPQPPCPARRLGGVCGGEQGLARHAAEVEAVAAHPVALDQRHAQAKLRGDRGDREARGTGADHRQIELRHPSVSTAAMRPAAATSAARATSGPRTRGEKMIARSGLPPAASTAPMPAPIEA